MESCLRIALLLFLVSGTLTQDFDLSDALGDLEPAPTPAKPKEKPKVQDDGGFGLDLEDALGPDLNPKPTPADNPPKSGGGGGDFNLDLEDALGPDPAPKPTVKPPKSGGGGGGDFGLDLEDALGPDLNPKPKPADNPPKSGGGGGGNFDDSTLFDVSNGDYKPEGGNSGGHAVDPGYNEGGADQPQEAGGGQIAAIVSAVGVALMGAASSYFAYQKKKLCFKIQGGQDPESGKGYHGTQSNPQSDPQVFSNLLRT